jgi:hypothetical protein
MSVFTLLKPKDLMHFFEIDTYEQARRTAASIKKQCNTQALTATHLARFLGVSVDEVLLGLK